MVINYNNFINTENESNKIILFNNDKKRFINKKNYFKFETNSNYDGISLIKNLKYGKEHKKQKRKKLKNVKQKKKKVVQNLIMV